VAREARALPRMRVKIGMQFSLTKISPKSSTSKIRADLSRGVPFYRLAKMQKTEDPIRWKLASLSRSRRSK